MSRFDRLMTEGSLDEGFLAVYEHQGRLAGAVTVGQSEELEALVKHRIAERAPADARFSATSSVEVRAKGILGP